MKRWLPLLALLAGLGCSISFAQSEFFDCIGQKTLYVVDVHGKVFDSSGVPISNAVVSLLRDGKLLGETQTDEQGKFRIRRVTGWYTIYVKSPDFQDASVEIHSGPDVRANFNSGEIKVILGVGSFHPCPSATTSSREVKKIIRAFNEKLKGNEQTDATQK